MINMLADRKETNLEILNRISKPPSEETLEKRRKRKEKRELIKSLKNLVNSK